MCMLVPADFRGIPWGNIALSLHSNSHSLHDSQWNGLPDASPSPPPHCCFYPRRFVSVNTNDAFVGIDSAALKHYGSSKIYPPAFDAGEPCRYFFVFAPFFTISLRHVWPPANVQYIYSMIVACYDTCAPTCSGAHVTSSTLNVTPNTDCVKKKNVATRRSEYTTKAKQN